MSDPTPSLSRGTAALVLGIVAVAVALIPFLGWIGVLLGIVALVLGIRGLPSVPAKTRSRVGLILGVIAMPLGLISVFVWVLLFAFAIPGLPSGPGPQKPPVSAASPVPLGP